MLVGWWWIRGHTFLYLFNIVIGIIIHEVWKSSIELIAMNIGEYGNIYGNTLKSYYILSMIGGLAFPWFFDRRSSAKVEDKAWKWWISLFVDPGNEELWTTSLPNSEWWAEWQLATSFDPEEDWQNHREWIALSSKPLLRGLSQNKWLKLYWLRSLPLEWTGMNWLSCQV